MSSLVQKWQAIKKQEEENLSDDESDEEDHAAKTEAQIEQWRQEQITRYLKCRPSPFCSCLSFVYIIAVLKQYKFHFKFQSVNHTITYYAFKTYHGPLKTLKHTIGQQLKKIQHKTHSEKEHLE